MWAGENTFTTQHEGTAPSHDDAGDCARGTCAAAQPLRGCQSIQAALGDNLLK